MSDQKHALTAEDWLMAGFRSLCTTGPESLKAEVIARKLKTTKGSFYWHFKDVADYKSRLIDFWALNAFDGVIEGLNMHAAPRLILIELCLKAVGFNDPVYGGKALEPSLRAWGKSDEKVARALVNMDQKRVAYLEELCHKSDLEPAPVIAKLLYSAHIGLETLGSPEENMQIMRLLLDRLIPTAAASPKDGPDL